MAGAALSRACISHGWAPTEMSIMCDSSRSALLLGGGSMAVSNDQSEVMVKYKTLSLRLRATLKLVSRFSF